MKKIQFVFDDSNKLTKEELEKQGFVSTTVGEFTFWHKLEDAGAQPGTGQTILDKTCAKNPVVFELTRLRAVEADAAAMRKAVAKLPMLVGDETEWRSGGSRLTEPMLKIIYACHAAAKTGAGQAILTDRDFWKAAAEQAKAIVAEQEQQITAQQHAYQLLHRVSEELAEKKREQERTIDALRKRLLANGLKSELGVLDSPLLDAKDKQISALRELAKAGPWRGPFEILDKMEPIRVVDANRNTAVFWTMKDAAAFVAAENARAAYAAGRQPGESDEEESELEELRLLRKLHEAVTTPTIGFKHSTSIREALAAIVQFRAKQVEKVYVSPIKDKTTKEPVRSDRTDPW